ncbi:MAG: hypothetical protein ACI9KN_001224 [Gammaproteobacteria bacterium]|jgi:hypothetical protein
MFSPFSIVRPFVRRLPILAFLLGLLITASSQADERPAFRVITAEFTLQNTLLLLDSTIEINLPDYINKAIDQGFAVPFMFEVEILAYSKYWLDKKLLSLKQQYQLHYLPMLDSYAMVDINSGQRLYFNSRQEAVQHLKMVYFYPMFDINNINQAGRVYARMRSGIDIDELPLPLKSSSLWNNDWDLRSDWFEWKIDPAQ